VQALVQGSSTREEEGVPRIKVRIESLSDLVFGLALSIGSLGLITHIPTTPTKLVSDVGLFAFSFLILVGVWLTYSRIISVLPVETSGILILNLVLLFCVAVEPFLYYVFQTAAFTFLDFSSTAFALDTGAMIAALSGMTYLVLRQENRGIHRLSAGSARGFKISMVSETVGAAVFLVSSLGVFWVEIPGFGFLRFILWYFALMTFFTGRAFRMIGRRRALGSRDS
jgi:uncharacterized membrane protein